MPDNRNIKKLISSPVVHTLLIYISGGWIVLEMADYFISHYDLTERFRDILLIIMIIGLPIALVLTWVFTREKEEKEEKGMGIFKISAYTLNGFDYRPYLLIIGLSILAAFAGTWVGKMIIDRISERVFRLVFRLLVTVTALRLLYVAVTYS